MFLAREVLRFLYPDQCALCRTIGRPAICSECFEEMAPFDRTITHETGSPLAASHALFLYEGRAGQAVRNLKYHRSMSLAEPMAALMAEAFAKMPPDAFDLVVPVPIHWTRRSSRGFNQSELLAGQMPACETGLLSRNRRTKPQIHLSGAERRVALEGAFTAKRSIQGATVLLVDDVLTTGGTAMACAHALVQAGAVRVESLSFCAEPD